MLAVEFNNLSRSDGSALFSLDETVVQASVFGPAPTTLAKALCDRAIVEVMVRRKVGQTGCEERDWENRIRSGLEGSCLLVKHHPRSAIVVILQEIQDSGSLLACCINASVLALLDAGLPMKSTLAAVSAVVTDDGIITYPSEKQEKGAKGQMIFTFRNKGLDVVGFIAHGRFQAEDFDLGLEKCKAKAIEVFDFYREALQRRCSKSVDASDNSRNEA